MCHRSFDRNSWTTAQPTVTAGGTPRWVGGHLVRAPSGAAGSLAAVAEQEAGPGSVVRVGLLGCGNVGAALVQLVEDRGGEITARTGVRLELGRVAVRSLARKRPVHLDDGVLTVDAAEVVADPNVDLVVEVMGGIEPARELILAALAAGKPVVTANKELLANHGAELFAAANAAGVDLLFEAAVAGGIPIMRPLRESLVGEEVRRVMGIVNGTTNFILTQMSEHGTSYAEALAEAQQLGYAERDPTADVEGYDAGAKAAILASLAFGAKVVAGDVYHEGISGITPTDIDFARRLGYVIKLLAIAELVGEPDGTEAVAVRVHPTMVPLSHPLAGVRDSFNAVFVEGAAVGDLMFYGRGAGGDPTGSAVLGDLIDAATNLGKGTHASLISLVRRPIRPIDELLTSYYLNLDVHDRPGVLRAIAEVFERHGVSIRSMEQEGTGDTARLILITHEAREADVQATLEDIRGLDVILNVTSVLRVIGAE
ncbi:MAG: homoserine dehydrogenase [Acidimicrobiales bacterium]|nr:homoserine dehydrogenase [Acidimicrobiales bacterium]